MEPITLAVVAGYVALKLIDQFIKEEGYGRIKIFFFPQIKYKTELVQVIYNTIDQFEKKYPYDINSKEFPFYQSQILFSKLLNHVLFKTKYTDSILKDFEKNQNIIIPTDQQLNEFFELFIKNVKSNRKLQKLYFEENYREEIFRISLSLDKIQNTIRKVEKNVDFLTDEKKKENYIYETEVIFDTLQKQVQRQLKKQLNSGKYLPNTFIETGEQKDHLRYLCHPFLYAEKVFNEIGIFDFRQLNESLKQNGKPEFNFDWDKLTNRPDTINFDNYNKYVSTWQDHLQQKLQILNTYARDGRSGYEYAFRDKFDDLDFLNSSVGIITEIAGQGKTNFLCDFVENFLIKHEIPNIFLTGAELNAENIRQSILSRIFPDSNNVSFERLLESIKAICYSKNKFFVFVIDGINENVKPKLLSQNIELFIEELLEHNFIKIILSCRTEYYKANFNNLMKSSFINKIQRITSLTVDRMNERLKTKLFVLYFHHFGLTFDRITPDAYNQLVSNFLLLRIFCEAYRGINVGHINTIHKQELFEKYYKIKCEEINKRLFDNDDFGITGGLNIRDFIECIIEYMVTNKQYFSVPLDTLVKNPNNKDMYIRFLDENILIKRDLDTDNQGIFLPSEVVNFTFDEFRDYLISSYLVENIYKKSIQAFEEFIQYEINQNSSISEGCSMYLFFETRRNNDKKLFSIIRNQPWYEDVFAKCVFSLKEDQITADDKKLLNEYVKKGNTFSKYIIDVLIFRNDSNYHCTLNIDLLFEIIRSLNEPDFKNFNKLFIYEQERYNYDYGRIDLGKIINKLQDIIIEEKQITLSDDKLFELMIYMFTSEGGYMAISIYERYSYKKPEKSKEQLRKALKSKSGTLNRRIKNFIESYEIKL